MDKRQFLQFRKCRREIIGFCYSIYTYDVYVVEKRWEIFINSIKDILDIQVDSILYEAYDNICKKNWIRVNDILLSIDNILRKILKENCSVFQLWRDDIWEENWNLLKCKNVHLANKVLQIKESQRIEVKPGGTECCIIRIHQGNTSFQLFSSENPWLESMERVSIDITQQHTNIYQWGFNGGFFIGTIEDMFPNADINVYISNLDLFGAVIHNICLADILNNEKLHLFYDPAGLDFKEMVSVSCSEENSAFIIDNVEHKAFVRGGIEIGKGFINPFSVMNKYTDRNITTVGKKIYIAINKNGK